MSTDISRGSNDVCTNSMYSPDDVCTDKVYTRGLDEVPDGCEKDRKLVDALYQSILSPQTLRTGGNDGTLYTETQADDGLLAVLGDFLGVLWGIWGFLGKGEGYQGLSRPVSKQLSDRDGS
jgi:hypothetical protein